MTRRATGPTSTIGLMGDGYAYWESSERPWRIEALVYRVNGRPEILGLRLIPREGAVARDAVITADRLRSLPLQKIKEMGIKASGFDIAGMLEAGRRVDREPGKPWPDEHYQRVAEVYEAALEAGEPPLPAIQKHWTVSRGAAAKYVKGARERRFLGYPERRGVAGTSSKTSPVKKARR